MLGGSETDTTLQQPCSNSGLAISAPKLPGRAAVPLPCRLARTSCMRPRHGQHACDRQPCHQQQQQHHQPHLSSSNSTSCWCLAAATASSWQWISNAAMSWVGHRYCCCCLRLLELGSCLHGKTGLHAVRHLFGMWSAVSPCLVSSAQAQPQRKAGRCWNLGA